MLTPEHLAALQAADENRHNKQNAVTAALRARPRDERELDRLCREMNEAAREYDRLCREMNEGRDSMGHMMPNIPEIVEENEP
jgi:seryl-tRNA synthetase